jgi:translocator protein
MSKIARESFQTGVAGRYNRKALESVTSRSIIDLLIAIAPVGAAALIGQIATFPNLKPWYEGLEKPGFSPPNWLFGPVWAILYLLMGIALWRILQSPGDLLTSTALILFFLQLALNAAWPWMFFALHNPLAGLLNIIPQLLLILATIAVVAQIDAIAALCLAPLSLWVAFASVLNFALWRLNG